MPNEALGERHRCRTSYAGTAQQLQQQRLGLIVGVVRQRHKITRLRGERRVAQLARRRFDAVPAQRRDIHMFDAQRDLVARAQIGAELRPRIGIRADAVVDMNCGKLPGEKRGEFVQQMQQHHRIHPAAQADQNGTARWEQRRDTRRDSFIKMTWGNH